MGWAGPFTGVFVLRSVNVIDLFCASVFRACHTRITSARKNCGDRQTRVSRDRDHNPTAASRWPGLSRNIKSFSASGHSCTSAGSFTISVDGTSSRTWWNAHRLNGACDRRVT